MAGQPRPNLSASVLGDAEIGLLAQMAFQAAHRAKLRGSNRLTRRNGKSTRGTEVALIFPPPAIPPRLARRNLWPVLSNAAAVIRLAGAILLEQNGGPQLAGNLGATPV
ncbi:MAG: hypothetical protein ACT4O2_05210 [Beijerinckiaceae bacterium]